MDMPFNTLTLAQSGALRRILDRVASGRDTLVAGDEDGHALLDVAAEQLAALRQRAIRVSVPPAGLSLSGLMAAITGRPDLSMQDDAVLEQGFRTLTVRDEACDGVVLLVSGAGRLQRPAFRYIQFACRAGKDLRVVLAGAGLADVLATPELAPLRARLADDAAPALVAPVPVTPAPAVVKPVAAAPAPPVRPAAPIEPAPIKPVPAKPAPAKAAPVPTASPASPARVRLAVPSRAGEAGTIRRAAWAAGMGVAATLALGLWAAHSTPPSGGRVAAAPAAPVQPVPVPAPPTVASVTPPAVASVTPPAVAAAATPPEPIPAAAAPVAASLEPAAPMEAALPAPPPAAAPPRAAARRPDTRAREAASGQSALRRPTPAQPRFERGERALAPLDEDRHPAPPRARQTEDTFGPMYSTLAQPRSFIGTYSANPDGTRAFRMEP